MKIKSIIIAALALLMATSCDGQNKQEVKPTNNKAMSKSIVIFFSHAGDNYAVGNIEVGNTKIVADYISEIAGEDKKTSRKEDEKKKRRREDERKKREDKKKQEDEKKRRREDKKKRLA